jgi:hypothetical protein
MKNNLMSVVLLLLFVNCQIAKQLEKNEYIEIKHVGIEQKLVKPVFISDKKVDIEVKGNYAIINNQKSEFLTERDKMIFSNSDYSVLITDHLTFQKISAFIHQYSLFLKNGGNYKTTNYSIISKGTTYNISYKQTGAFFSSLIKFLKAENCNQESVYILNSYFNSNFY